MFAAARRGDATAPRSSRAEAERIALAIAAIVPVVDPELVILGGGIGRNGDLLLEPVAPRRSVDLSPFRVRLEVSPLGEDAAVGRCGVGGAATAQDRLFERGHGGPDEREGPDEEGAKG